MPSGEIPLTPVGTYLDPALVEALQDRLSRAEGHVRGIKRMLAERQDCDDILTQVAGVKSAITEISIKLLEGHLETCVADALRSGNGVLPVARFRRSLSRTLRH
ncbi:MAG: metal-sensitive transcriptional regulator [Chloroflexi bacterium]|nr:metal-sensitive transcriptional regulator [Chloroflexota bacterium]